MSVPSRDFRPTTKPALSVLGASTTARKARHALDAPPEQYETNGHAAIRKCVELFSEPARVDGKFFARGANRIRLRGVTYGPFMPDDMGHPFPGPKRVRQDFRQMQSIGINAIRVYHLPSAWFLESATDAGLNVLLDIPWAKHLCFLSSRAAQAGARSAVREAAQLCRRHPCVFAYSIGNEVPADVVRWHGARRVERFLAELADTAKQADPARMVTFANFPPAEYLDLSFLDFATFNVYLHDRETFRRYLFRLQNLTGEKPLVLGELGMDTLRNGELAQAEFLGGHLEEAESLGLAGSFVFSWTDEWHTGAQPITDWAFGITNADRTPKAAYHALEETFDRPLYERLSSPPAISVVVCSYNGARTLRQCLESLVRLDYPNYEVILVDDGSTDNTQEIVADFPTVRNIQQENRGLSVARNVGLYAAKGSIVAYTDSDCYADPDWLTHLALQLETSDAAAVGGPNLTPEDGRVAACVAASPGQPTHVLESDQVAEHVPGCNMAFRRDVLESINGFDPQYIKAGDDVDICWRLQQAGHWITFAPAAFVWHHRRQTPRTYLRQQAGYGEAEAWLRFKHPDKFNVRGSGIWRGVLYGPSLRGLVLDDAIIYRGTFGTGFFQCIYRPGPAHWAMLPSSLEWHVAAGAIAAVGIAWFPAVIIAAVMVALSVLIAALQSAQAELLPEHRTFKSRLLVAALCYAQPLVRSWARYKARYRGQRAVNPSLPQARGHLRRLHRVREIEYWSETSTDRTHLVQLVIDYLGQRRCGRTVDTGWMDCDLEVFANPWALVRVCTVQEEHGSGRCLIRVRLQLVGSSLAKAAGGLALAAAVAVGAADVSLGVFGAAMTTMVGLFGALGGLKAAARVAQVFDTLAPECGLLRVAPAAEVEGSTINRSNGGP